MILDFEQGNVTTFQPLWAWTWACNSSGIIPPIPEAGGYHSGKGYNVLPDTYYRNTDDGDILSFIVSWTLKQ